MASRPPPSFSSTLSTKDLETGYITSKPEVKHEESARVTMPELATLPRRKPLPESSAGYLQDSAHGPTPTKTRIFSGLSMALAGLKEKMAFRGNKKKQRLFFGGIIAGFILLALVIGLAVGLTRKKMLNLPLPLHNGGPYLGDLTYYTPALGACGITSSPSQNVCAVSRIVYDAASIGSNPNHNPLCGLKLRLKRNDRSVDVTVVDRCVGCKPMDIDVSPSVFEKLAPIDDGRVKVQWAWLKPPPVSIPKKIRTHDGDSNNRNSTSPEEESCPP